MQRNRFLKESNKKEMLHSNGFSVMLFILIIALFVVAVSLFAKSGVKDDKSTLEAAVNRDIIHCYAVEGFYPPSVSYLVESYGLNFDSDRFIVDYEYQGTNIMPSVMVIERKAQ